MKQAGFQAAPEAHIPSFKYNKTMKRLTIFIFAVLYALASYAQTEADDSARVQAVVDALLTMRDAAASNDTAALRRSAEALRACEVAEFRLLKCKDDSVIPLDGHLLFNEDFADSLAADRDVISRSEALRTTTGRRSATSANAVLTKTHCVKARQSCLFTFNATGSHIIHVVAEAGGRVSLKIHARNSSGFDKRFDDTTDVHPGRAHRKTTLRLPPSPASRVSLEVVNRSNKDISFVIVCS